MGPTTAPVSVAANNPYGLVVLDGLSFIERFQIFAEELTISSPNEVHTNLRLTMPGTANFLLKGLARDITIPFRPGGDLPGSQDRRFRFRVTNMESTPWFFSSGLGCFDDRVVDTLCFGNAQFPYPIIPPIPVQSTGTLIYEVEDMGFLASPLDLDYYPYTIHFAFIGTYLIPAQQAGAAQTWLYSVSAGRKQ